MKDTYSIPDPALWTGRTSGKQEYLHEKVSLVKSADDTLHLAEGNSFVLLGYACDEGVRRNNGRPGAAEGPDAIRKELSKMANHLRPQDLLIDSGNVCCVNGQLEKAQELLSTHVGNIIKQGGLPVLLGGGHDISYAHFTGLRSALDPAENLGIINFDAHFDLRTNERGNHSGSPFYQIAEDSKKHGRDFRYLCLGIRREANPAELFERADDLGVDYLELPDFNIHYRDTVEKRLSSFLDQTDRVYVTVDMDGFSSAFSPGVSASSPYGFSPEIVQYCLKQIIASGKLMGMDVAETNPKYDRDNQTAKLAAGIIHYVIHENSLL